MCSKVSTLCFPNGKTAFEIIVITFKKENKHSVLTLINVAFYVGKESVLLRKYPGLVFMMKKNAKTFVKTTELIKVISCLSK